MKLFPPDEIRKWHRVFKRQGELFEIRLLGERNFTLSGYFTDVEEAIKAIEPQDRRQTFQIYFTVNEVNPACSSRKQFNQFLQVSGSATSKNDITYRRWLPIDIDVKRPTDISSTNEEKEFAHKRAGEVFLFMRENRFPDPVVCDSSSGYHLYYPIEVEANQENEKLVKETYKILGSRFTDERIKIDSAVGDANRIMRLPGTWGRKGRDTEERPHRMAKILSEPTIITPVKEQFIRDFVAKYRIVEDTTSYSRQYNGERFDLRDFIRSHGIRVRNEMPFEGGTKFILEECPFDSSHKAPDSALFQSANGAIGFKCFHDSCSTHDWHELRQMLDPSAYAQRNNYDYNYKPQRQTYIPQSQPIEIKQESEDVGKKWLSLDEIEDVNIDNLPRIKTGFYDIDYKLGGGLFLQETTIISGINGSGKSSWLNTLILNSIQDGFPAALWTGELQASRLKRWLVQAAAGSNHVVESRLSQGKYYVPKNIIEKISTWMHGKFLLYNNDYSSNYAQILNDMKEPVQKGYKLFILDNLFAMSLDGIDGDENLKQKLFILMLVDFAKKNNIHVILVAHPRKVVSFLRKEDILGSSALQNAVDNIFIIHRTGTDFEKRGCELFTPALIKGLMSYGNVIEICKNREYGMMTEFIGLHYDPISRRFSDDHCRNRIYGWEEQPTQAEMPFDDTYEEAPF
jgi:archaellum biogenesis ATPase FlaH